MKQVIRWPFRDPRELYDFAEPNRDGGIRLHWRFFNGLLVVRVRIPAIEDADFSVIVDDPGSTRVKAFVVSQLSAMVLKRGAGGDPG